MDKTASVKPAVVAEFIGTAFLLATVVGSGIMGERLANGNAAIALLANSVATGAILLVLILTFGPISGAYLNPIVTVTIARQHGWSGAKVLLYIAMQGLGSLVGVISANVMFGLPPVFMSHHTRTGAAQMFSEFLATFGLMNAILFCARSRPNALGYVVAAYITAAYWFTSSTSFANPVVTFARSFTDTFSGIRLMDVPLFIVAQAAGGIGALALFRWTMSQSIPRKGEKATLARRETI